LFEYEEGTTVRGLRPNFEGYASFDALSFDKWGHFFVDPTAQITSKASDDAVRAVLRPDGFIELASSLKYPHKQGPPYQPSHMEATSMCLRGKGVFRQMRDGVYYGDLADLFSDAWINPDWLTTDERTGVVTADRHVTEMQDTKAPGLIHARRRHGNFQVKLNRLSWTTLRWQ